MRLRSSAGKPINGDLRWSAGFASGEGLRRGMMLSVNVVVVGVGVVVDDADNVDGVVGVGTVSGVSC